MRKINVYILGMVVGLALTVGSLVTASSAHADYFNYPCNYPFVGMSGDVNLIVDAGGQFCDGPMEVNGSHYHCESGGANVNLGVLGFASQAAPGLSLGGFGGSGLGARGGSCTWRCPDNSMALPPNPPAQWIQHTVVVDKYNDCRDHMTPAGFWSDPQHPESGPPAPGQHAGGPDVTPNDHSKPAPPNDNQGHEAPGPKPEGDIEQLPAHSPINPGSPIPLP